MSFLEKWNEIMAKKNNNNANDTDTNDNDANSNVIDANDTNDANGSVNTTDANDADDMNDKNVSFSLPKSFYDDDGYLCSEQSKFGLNFLKKADANSGINLSKKECYLDDDEFNTVFNMTPDKFAGLRLWQQRNLKRKVGLF